MKKTFLLSAILACCLGACEYQKFDDAVPETGGDYFGERMDCSTSCCMTTGSTVELVVEDRSGNPLLLDSFVVTNRAGLPLLPAAGGRAVFGASAKGAGRYVVLNDGWVGGHQGMGVYVLAKGFRGGVQVFRESYKISADCCHVTKISGKDRIIVP